MMKVRDIMKRRKKRDFVRSELLEERTAEKSRRYLCMRMITRAAKVVSIQGWGLDRSDGDLLL